jgi:adenine phosphoribosyltransferase
LRKFQSKSAQIDRSIPLVIAGVESKGFLTGPVILVPAFESFFKECQFLPVRKKGKLPGETIQSNDYETEYSKGNQLEVMIDHFPESKKKVYMIITDDILATGGTIHATIELMKKVEKEKGIEIEILDLFFLDSIKELEEHPGRKQLLSDGFPSRTFLLPMIEN